MIAAVAKPNLSRPHLLDLLRQMLRIRRFEEKCAELYTQEKIRGFLHLYVGEEAIAVGVMAALTPEDAVVSTYREHGHALAKGVPADRLMAEMYGKVEGCSRGRGGSMHVFDKQRNLIGGNAIVGGGLPIAVGLALATKMSGKTALATCFFGEGAVAEGEFHESMNLAVLWRLPVLFVCENNLYAMGTHIDRSEAQSNLVQKAESYGIGAVSVDGMDVVAVEAAALRAASSIRAGEGPLFMECRTYRFRAHSMFDAQLYREKAEVETWMKKCPIERFSRWLKESQLLHNDDFSCVETEVASEVEAAVAFAEAGTWEPKDQLERFVYADRSPQ